MQSELSDIKKKLNSAKKYFEQAHTLVRANNILLFKVEDNADFNKNLFTNVLQIIKQAEVNISEFCIVTIVRLGNKIGHRPILIKLIAPRWKQFFFNQVDNFRNMDIGIPNTNPKKNVRGKNLC